MESSHDSHYEDVWSPSLREDVFSNFGIGHSWSSEPRHHPDHSPLPSEFYSQPIQVNTPPFQQQRDSSSQPTNQSSMQPPVPLHRTRSHLDPPNFPLQSDPVANNSNTSGRPQATTTFHSRPTTPSSRDLPRPVTPLSEDLWSSSGRSDTPWPEADDFNDFVDLTAESSPLTMPTTKRPRTDPPSPSRRDTSSAPSSQNKRRRIRTVQSSRGPPLSVKRSHSIEAIDLRDIDDDEGLSRVLEQQRLATIKAQQEQANKPVKLSTLQCIICMEPMKNLTATHCGKSLHVSKYRHQKQANICLL